MCLIAPSLAFSHPLTPSPDFSHPLSPSLSYATQGVCCAEAEVDALTGECCLRRVDVAMDQGCPLNPLSDLGQVEGALMMSIGYFLTEQVRTSPQSS